ncbi:Serine/threonine-protein phosphatase 7 long form homolog, partial [Linum grandiflorum]
HDRRRPASVSEFRLLFDEGTRFQWIPYVGDEYSDIVEREYRVVAPLFCFRSVMWHHPDRVLRQFGMEQPIPRTEMTEAEVTRLLGLTRRREIGLRQTMQQYLAQWDARDDHVAETAPVRHPEHWHFHDQYMDWYRTFSRRWIIRRDAVHEAVVSIVFHFVLRLDSCSI